MFHLKISFIKEKTEGRENDLIIRKFPSEGITVNHIKTYVRHLISTGFKPDMIVLDYIDCVESTRRYNDEWSGEGNVMRGFESMLTEYNIVGWTAVQGNRSSVSSDVVTGDQMGESSNLNKRYEKERELNERLSEELELLKQEKERKVLDLQAKLDKERENFNTRKREVEQRAARAETK